VQFDHGFVLHRPVGAWKSTLPVGDIGLTTSRDILEAMATGGGPRQQLVALGYAGWAPGQLEDEILRNGWLTVPANLDLIFDVAPEERYGAAMQALGVNTANLSEEAGHA
jgi:putative transcriptional regulator